MQTGSQTVYILKLKASVPRSTRLIGYGPARSTGLAREGRIYNGSEAIDPSDTAKEPLLQLRRSRRSSPLATLRWLWPGGM